MPGYDFWKTTDPREDECPRCGISPDCRRALARSNCDDPKCPCGLYRDPDEAYERYRDERMERK
jgi:hypothetical protein